MFEAAEPKPQGQQSAAPAIEIRPPKLLTPRTVAVCNFYGMLLLFPVLLVMLAVTLMSFGIWTFLLPLFAIVTATCFLPVGFGNAYIAGLMRGLRPSPGSGEEQFLVQLTFNPRLRTGWRALFEDADDIGWVEFTDSALVFTGDSVNLKLPFESIRGLDRQTIGLRGLFLYGARSVLRVSGLPETKRLILAERSSRLLPISRRTARRLYAALERRAGPANAP